MNPERPRTPSGKSVVFQGSADYRIVVKGTISELWRKRLSGFKVTELSNGDGNTLSELTGHLADQSELMGILETLHSLHLPILEIRVLDSDKSL